MKIYSAKETADKLNTNIRNIQRKCKKYNVRKKDNRYLITDEIIKGWQELKKQNDKKTTIVATNDTTQQRIDVQALENDVENYKTEIASLKAEILYLKNRPAVTSDDIIPKQSTIDEITKELQKIVDAGGNKNLMDKKLIEYEAIHRDKENQTK